MKKITSIVALAAFTLVGTSMAQMVIPGEQFSVNAARFTNRPVTIKNIEIVPNTTASGLSIGGPSGTMSHAAPGAIGTPAAPNNTPCRPPRGHSEVNVFFKGDPEFKACFFMKDVMKAQMDRECANHNTPATISFRGTPKLGYAVTAYRLGL